MSTQHLSTELDIFAIVKLLWGQKLLIISTIVVAATLSVWLALTQEQIYMAELKAMPSTSSLNTTDSSLQSTIALRLKGFGNASGEYEKHLVAVQVLRSRSFIADFIERHQLLPLLYGVTGWEPDTNKLIWNHQIYQPHTKAWTTDTPPTLQEATQQFLLNNMFIFDDRMNRVLTVQVFHHSPILAAQWANWLLHDLNQYMQEKEQLELAEKLNFYQQTLVTTLSANTRDLLRVQIEEHTYKQLLNRSQNQFLFEIIDPPMVPEKRAYPRRGLLVILGTFLGGILALVLAFLSVLIFPPVEQLQQPSAGEKSVL